MMSRTFLLYNYDYHWMAQHSISSAQQAGGVLLHMHFNGVDLVGGHVETRTRANNKRLSTSPSYTPFFLHKTSYLVFGFRDRRILVHV